MGALLVALAAACGSSASNPSAVQTQPIPSSTPTYSTSQSPKPLKNGKPAASPSASASQGSTKTSPAPKGGGGGKPKTTQSPSSSNGSASFPQAGQYTYDQSGWEQFCQQGPCQRSDLPDTATQNVSYTSKSNTSAVMVLDQHPSDQRTVKVTLHLDRGGASVTDIKSHFTYGPFTFDTEITPDPPMEVLRLPLEVGAHWSGSWSGKISGSYSIRVVSKGTQQVAGKAVDTYRIAQTLELSGDVQGKQTDTQDFDPSTGMIVHVTGHASFTSQYGSYETQYEQRLRSGGAY